MNARNLLLGLRPLREPVARPEGGEKGVADAVLSGLPTPSFSASLAYFDSYRSERLPANLLQAQRDYFGAHTYERTDQPKGKWFHFDWVGDKNQHQV